MAYAKTVWVNGQAPALDAEHMNKIENELETLDQRKGSATYTATIGTAWVEDENTGVKTQSVAIAGVTAQSTAMVDHVYTGSGTSDDYAAFVEAENQYLNCITNGYADTAEICMGPLHVRGLVNPCTRCRSTGDPALSLRTMEISSFSFRCMI
jgi:hypothetical protein